MAEGERGPIPERRVLRIIMVIRGEKVILDSDLAELYGVETKRLNEQVRRNMNKFPVDFMFKLNKDLLPGIHPSPGGYFKMAKTIFQRLQEGSAEYCSICKDDSCEVK